MYCHFIQIKYKVIFKNLGGLIPDIKFKIYIYFEFSPGNLTRIS